MKVFTDTQVNRQAQRRAPTRRPPNNCTGAQCGQASKLWSKFWLHAKLGYKIFKLTKLGTFYSLLYVAVSLSSEQYHKKESVIIKQLVFRKNILDVFESWKILIDSCNINDTFIFMFYVSKNVRLHDPTVMFNGYVEFKIEYFQVSRHWYE